MAAVAILRIVAQLLQERARASLQPAALPLDPVKLQARQGEAVRLRAVALLLEEEALQMEADPRMVITTMGMAMIQATPIPATPARVAAITGPATMATAKAPAEASGGP